MRAAHWSGDVGRREREPIAGLVGEREASLADLEPVDDLDETVPVRQAAELPVCHNREAELLLHCDDIANRIVLGGLEHCVAHGALAVVAPRLAQRPRTQERPDVMRVVPSASHSQSSGRILARGI